MPSGGGKKARIIALSVLGGIAALFVVAALAAGALSDESDSAVLTSTTVTSPLITAAPNDTPASGVKPGESALNPSDGQTPTDVTIISVFDLAVGDCFNVQDADTISDVDDLACDHPHDFEVFATFDIDGGPSAPFPGGRAVDRDAESTCTGGLFASYVGLDYQASRLFVQWLPPSRRSWNSAIDDRAVICVATSPTDAPLTESVRGTNE